MRRTDAAFAILMLMANAIEADAQLRAQTFATGFTQPVAFVQDPTDRNVFFVVEQRGRILAVRSGASVTRLSRSSVGDLARRGTRAARSRVRARLRDAVAASTSTSRIRRAIPSLRAFVRSANPLVADPSSRFDLRWNGAGSPALRSSSRSRTTTAGISPSGPTGSSTSASATADPATIPTIARRIPVELLGKMLRVDVNVPDTHPDRLRRPGRQSVRPGRGARPEIWSFGLAEPVALQLRRSVPRGGTGALVVGDVGQNRLGRDRLRAARARRSQLRLAESRRCSRQRHITPARLHAAGRSDSRVRPATGQLDHRRRRLSRHLARVRFPGRYFFADFVTSRVWSIALTLNGAGEATARICASTPADLAACRSCRTSAPSAWTRTASCISSATAGE